MCVFSALGLSQCSSDGYQHAAISGDSQAYALVLYDSPTVQSMVDQALHVEQEHIRGLGSPDKSVRLTTFLESRPGKLFWKLADDMGKEPGFDVPGQTRFRILFESNVLPYSKVEFERGPFKGRVGWLSRGSFDDPRTGY
jgi:hypothetical protein